MRPRPPGHSDPSPRGFRGQRGSGARTGLRVAVGPGPVIPLLTLCFFSGLHRPNPALIRCLPAHQRLWGSSQEVRISGPRGILENRSLVSRVHLLQKAALTAAPECHASLSHSPWSLMTRGIASCITEFCEKNTSHREHPLSTTQEMPLNMDFTRWSIPKSILL